MSLESLKGTCVALGSARALMHMPSVVSDRLMLTASFALKPAQHNSSLRMALPDLELNITLLGP